MYVDFNNKLLTRAFSHLLIRHMTEIPSTPTCYTHNCENCEHIKEFYSAGVLEEIIKQAESYILTDVSELGWWQVRWNDEHTEILSERVDITLFQRMWNIRSIVEQSRAARKAINFYKEEDYRA